MKSTNKKSNKKAAFTIIELLTVMSIIVILFGLLVPALTMVRRHAKKVKQKAQFHSIDAALQLFHGEFEYYPPSDEKDGDDEDYPGAMRMAEALLGQDLLGFHPQSLFMQDGENDNLDGDYKVLYPTFSNPPDPGYETENLKSRKGLYLPVDGANAYSLSVLYGGDPNAIGNIVLCDGYPNARNPMTGKRIGMPVLYYKADTSNILHDRDNLPSEIDDKGNIYNYRDNMEIVDLYLPWDKSKSEHHPIGTGQTLGPEGFYDMIENQQISATPRPYNPETYILISAGFDGEYGTGDDVFNFEK